ncbi:hypothetical protein [Allostreptomyces psammosilenae]|uniref:Uncharacterized protein n=1 Tax=Allostreptomyces psammosilenae TaxID=1892865 RepID=A0A852ZSD1_9ACTN|nr:hypothetical protein [Allostreptomyces psammosilenae]NYI04397.1 hypothetical protein [Allostreptomyces psammosilenae]
MSVRVIVTLESGADWTAVAEGLRRAGALEVLPPREALPGVLVALFPEGSGAGAVAAARGVAGVADAEPDAWRFTQGPESGGP